MYVCYDMLLRAVLCVYVQPQGTERIEGVAALTSDLNLIRCAWSSKWEVELLRPCNNYSTCASPVFHRTRPPPRRRPAQAGSQRAPQHYAVRALPSPLALARLARPNERSGSDSDWMAWAE